MYHAIYRSIVCLITLLISACDAPTDTATREKPGPAVSSVEITATQPAMGQAGVPIDPGKKSVSLANDPDKATRLEHQLANLGKENSQTQEKLTTRMNQYDEFIHDPGSKQNISSQMSADLEDYKRQSLEMYKKQQALSQQETIDR